MQNFISYKNSKIAYLDVGKGTTIVLLHGFLENATMWNEIAKELSKKNRVICIDLLGHGKSDCIGYVHTMNDMAEAVKEILNFLRLRKFYIIGHSMGGYVSLAFAEKYLKNIKGLCLLNSSAQADSEERKELRTRVGEMAKKNYSNLVRMSISNLFLTETKAIFTSEIAQIKKEALQTPVQGYIAATKGMQLRENKEVVLQTIPKRLIIAGENDPVTHFNSILKEAKRTKTSLIKLSGGHMSHIEDKDELIASLKKFIKG